MKNNLIALVLGCSLVLESCSQSSECLSERQKAAAQKHEIIQKSNASNQSDKDKQSSMISMPIWILASFAAMHKLYTN